MFITSVFYPFNLLSFELFFQKLFFIIIKNIYQSHPPGIFSCKCIHNFIPINFSISVCSQNVKCIKSSISLTCPIERFHLFRTEILFLQVHVVTRNVSKILKIVCILGNICLHDPFRADFRLVGTISRIIPESLKY